MRNTNPVTEDVRDAWDRIAPRFDRFTTPLSVRLGEDVLRRAGLGPGTRFLDVAAGSGALSLPAARLGARVLAVDLSPAMLERLKARAREAGVQGVETRVMDARVLDLDDEVFDVTGSQNGVSLLPHVRAGLREMVRVTRPGGRVAVVAFGPLARAEWLGFFMGAVRAVAPGFDGLSSEGPPPPFQLADREKMRREMLDAGLSATEVEPCTWEMQFRDGGHLHDVVTSSNPIAGRLVGGLSDEQRDEVRRVLDGMLRERSGGGPGGVLTCEMNVGVGTR